MDNPEKPATQGTQDEEKNNNTGLLFLQSNSEIFIAEKNNILNLNFTKSRD